MKSTFKNEHILGTRATLAGDAPEIKSKFKSGLATIKQELWLVLSLFIIAGLFHLLGAPPRLILGLYTLPPLFFGLCLWAQTRRAYCERQHLPSAYTSLEEYRSVCRFNSFSAELRPMVGDR